jgi:hypothetical protein
MIRGQGRRGGRPWGRYMSNALKWGSQGVRLARDVYTLKQLINVEQKVNGTSWTSDPNTTGAVVSLGDIAQGDDFTERNGRKVRIKSIRHKGKIIMNSSVTTNTDIRAIIVRDNSGTTTQPTIGQVFANAAAMFNNLQHLSDPQTNSRFSILSDFFFTVTPEHPVVTFDVYQKSDWHMVFSGTGATDEGKGGLYLMIASTEATNDPVVTASTNVRYIDN